MNYKVCDLSHTPSHASPTLKRIKQMDMGPHAHFNGKSVQLKDLYYERMSTSKNNAA